PRRHDEEPPRQDRVLARGGARLAEVQPLDHPEGLAIASAVVDELEDGSGFPRDGERGAGETELPAERLDRSNAERGELRHLENLVGQPGPSLQREELALEITPAWGGSWSRGERLQARLFQDPGRSGRNLAWPSRPAAH